MIGQLVVEAVRRDPAAWRAQAALRDAGGEVFAVGGVVRDVALGVPHNDVDLMVRNLSREQVREALQRMTGGKVSEVGKSFGILEYRGRDGCVQVSLPRQDRFIGVHHTDVDVTVDPSMSVEEDMFRRDYTINAMAVRLPDGLLVDPTGGLHDAAIGLVRAVNMQVLADDPLRVVRGVVLATKRALILESETVKMLRENADGVAHLPADRIHDELDKIMGARCPNRGIELLQHVGVLSVILPEVAAMVGFDQKSRYHKHLLFDHVMIVLDTVAWLTDDKDVRLAALLHDVGKPGSAWVDDDGFQHYYKKIEQGGATLGDDHEILGARMARRIMTRLRYSTGRINKVSDLVRWHMFPYFDTKKGARRFLARVGDDLADDLLMLRFGDDEGKEAEKNAVMRRLVDEVRTEELAFSIKDLAIDGHDLIELGVPAGPERGLILKTALDRVIDEQVSNDREDLLELVESLRDHRSGSARQGVGSR